MKLSMTIGSDGSATLLFTPENVKDGELIGELDADLKNSVPQAQMFTSLMAFAEQLGELPPPATPAA